jgi:guanylate kinase
VSDIKTNVIVVAGPSGVGKTTLIRKAMEQHPQWTFSVSATTRPQRSHETDGEDYFFLTNEEFNRRIIAGDFIEYANVYGRMYGTLKSEFDRAAAAGLGLLVEIDTVGCLSIHALHPEIPIVAIVPPRYSVLRERLVGRGTESSDEIELRTKNAWLELARMSGFDFVVINDDLEKASTEFSDVVKVVEKGNFAVRDQIERILATAGEDS